ncbi:hypothetical protein GQ54DRAFT_342047 [Martensiomyces pterosporus]|nr:hypothetical protein GQ54DRAFT_342047 [Martensiomyces pterosporus]
MLMQTTRCLMKKAVPGFMAMPAATTRGLSTAIIPRQHQRTPLGRESPAANSADVNRSPALVESKGEIMGDAYSTIAEEYDRLIRIATFGNPRRKTIFVNKMAPLPGERLLDVAGGTCDIAQRYLAYQDTVNHDSASTVHVVDFNPAMLAVGKRHLADTQWMRDGRVTFAQGDAENLADIPDNTYDLYSISMGMHNLANREKALAEAYRVLKPGGRFACLEAGYIESPILRTAVGWYWNYVVPMMGRVLTSNYSSFMEMMKSARDFPCQHEFVETIRSAGFHLPGKGEYAKKDMPTMPLVGFNELGQYAQHRVDVRQVVLGLRGLAPNSAGDQRGLRERPVQVREHILARPAIADGHDKAKVHAGQVLHDGLHGVGLVDARRPHLDGLVAIDDHEGQVR